MIDPLADLKDPPGGRWPIDRDLGWSTTFFDVVSGRDIPVTAELSDTEVAFFDPHRKCMARWKYVDIIHAFEPNQRLDYVFITRDDPNAQLTVGHIDLMRLLLQSAPQLQRKRTFSARLGQFTRPAIVFASVGLVAVACVVWIYQNAPHWLRP